LQWISESHDMKNETPQPHLGDKPPKL
jgi:hypothetical protein